MIPSSRPRQNAPHRPSAVRCRHVGPNLLAQPQRATVAFRLTESEARKYGLGYRWRMAMKRRLEFAARKSSLKAQLAAAIARLINHAETARLSQREMTRKAGLSWGSFRRCRDGKANPVTWLPKVRTALDRINVKI